MITITLSNGKIRTFSNDEGNFKLDVSPAGALTIRDRPGSLVAAFAAGTWADFDGGMVEFVHVKSGVAVELVRVDSGALIPVIKAIRDATNWGLKDAKEFVDSVGVTGNIPRVLLRELSRDHAETLIRSFASIGGVLRVVNA